MRVAPEALHFATRFRNESPSNPVFGWLIGVPNTFVLAHAACFELAPSRDSPLLSSPKDAEKDLADLERLLPSGIFVVGFYASHNGASDGAVAQHRASLPSGLIGCLFSAKDVFVARNVTDALVWSVPVTVDPGCIKRFQSLLLPIVMTGEGFNGHQLDDETVLLVGTDNPPRSVVLGQVKSKSLGSIFPSSNAGARGGLDFSRVLQPLVRHVATGSNAWCPDVTGSGFEMDLGARVAKAVGYFPAETLLSDAISSLQQRQQKSFCRFGQPHGLALALPLSLEPLRRRIGLSTGWREDVTADVTDIWAQPPKRLVNVHEEVAEKHGLGDAAKVSLVQGYYEYCHYMQDNFNDDGWGCAYRSLQTLCSWLQLQGVVKDVSRPLPSHKQIQDALDQLGEPVGPKQWIGAIEISMILNHWFGLDCRIISIASGGEVFTKTDEVIFFLLFKVCVNQRLLFTQIHRHFASEGSPIMIGGGVLAWTLLGICSNGKETKYLILDPHFTGADDLKIICKKGWVAWMPASIFRKESFYNFCCPMVPK